MKKYIFFDLDGTLLTTDKILTERTKKALEAAADQGVVLVPATGRPLCGLPKELLALPFIKYAVTANGARILETKTEHSSDKREARTSITKRSRQIRMFYMEEILTRNLCL